jgi:hypothetical protein
MIDTSGLMKSSSRQSQCCPSAAAIWTPELDDALRPCEDKALEAGIMMTPVLVMNGKPVHQGSVPDADQTRNWIESTYKQTNKANNSSSGIIPAGNSTIGPTIMMISQVISFDDILIITCKSPYFID